MVEKQETERIGRYQILRKLGRGGMGFVYKALVPVIDKVVAVKVLQPFEAMELLQGYARLKEIFTFEAVTMAGLHHPALVDVWDYDVDGRGRPFFVMEYFCNNLGRMIGEDFQLLKKSRPVRPDKVLAYGRQLLQGLAYLHDREIVHRDIKPFNIMITDDDRVKICDFGMALVRQVSSAPNGSMQIGSPFYAAPEQSREPDAVDGRADLYSAGVLLYRLLTGELPGMRSFALSRVNPLYDAAWDAFFARALALLPAGRFQTASEMLAALTRLHVNLQGGCGQLTAAPAAAAATVPLRSTPENVCGEKARLLFGLNEQFRAQGTGGKKMIEEPDGLLRDAATGLIWQQGGSVYRLCRQEAQGYIDGLNARRHAGRGNWRLPTVNELFSLLSDELRACRANPERPGLWFWSCDSHGARDAWYVNLDMEYADWQDVSCRNFVRAVCSG
ncbi:MAG: protein kinase [Desulfobulbaceae bacterium]|nr:protein kinase [Desulfobulbaceae bacterium]